MKNLELERLKKYYGENFAKLCRELFPTILESEGVLSEAIINHFAKTRSLYYDITNNNLTQQFKNYVLSLTANNIKKPANYIFVEPFELMKKAGYTLYKCETDEEVKSFRYFWDEDEELCTFKDNDRINTHLVFFAVKDNVRQIKREDFSNPSRQDEYGTSVISIQFSKHEKSTLSIKNRYNHSVENPDATFSNNLENIIAGLTQSFIQKYEIKLASAVRYFELPGYVLANDNKLYKYNSEINNKYYCTDNIYIDELRNVTEFDKSRYLLIDYMLLDLKDIKITYLTSNFDEHSVLSKILNNTSKITIIKKDDIKNIAFISENSKRAIISVDQNNRIVQYYDENITAIDDEFLYNNLTIESIVIPNVTQIKDFFLFHNNSIKTIIAPNLLEIGNFFLFNNCTLEKFYAPKLFKIENEILSSNNPFKMLTDNYIKNSKKDCSTLHSGFISKIDYQNSDNDLSESGLI